jgi:hypothetical protein
VAERFKAAASKAVEGFLALREFESHPFRHLWLIGIMVESLNGKRNAILRAYFTNQQFHYSTNQLECGEMSELAEGARLEIVCAAKSGTEGSNPSLSAILIRDSGFKGSTIGGSKVRLQRLDIIDQLKTGGLH